MSDHVAEAAQAAAHGGHGGHGQDPAQYILHHVADGHTWELPGKSGFAHDYDLGAIFGHWQVGGLDFTPTKASLMMTLAVVFLVLVLPRAVSGRGLAPKGRFQTTLETLYLFIRDDVAKANIHHHPEKFVPYLATVFFFILTMNLFGLIPYAQTATANVNVTAVLAIVTFLVTQGAGMAAQGVFGYWAHLVPAGIPLPLWPLMFVVEFIGLFTKPFALTVRLFANMTAGHIVIFFLLGLIFTMKTVAVAPVSVAFVVGVYVLELAVAFIQAYIFTLLSSVFIGMASHGH